MTVQIDDCTCIGEGLFADLAKYRRVGKWLSAIAAGKSKFRPRTVFVRIGDKTYCWGAGIDLDHRLSMAFIVDIVKDLSVSRRVMPNDKMIIKADAFSRELNIEL